METFKEFMRMLFWGTLALAKAGVVLFFFVTMLGLLWLILINVGG